MSGDEEDTVLPQALTESGSADQRLAGMISDKSRAHSRNRSPSPSSVRRFRSTRYSTCCPVRRCNHTGHARTFQKFVPPFLSRPPLTKRRGYSFLRGFVTMLGASGRQVKARIEITECFCLARDILLRRARAVRYKVSLTGVSAADFLPGANNPLLAFRRHGKPSLDVQRRELAARDRIVPQSS